MLYLQQIPLQATSHAAQHLAAHALLKNVLQAEYGLREVALVQDERGKPFLPDHPAICISLAHCRAMVACALDRGAVGVDVEPIRSVRERVLQRSFSEAERELVTHADNPDLTFTRLWTLKESYVKCIGMGLAFPLHEIWFDHLDGEIHSNHPECGFTQAIIEDAFVVSLCHAAGQGQMHRIQKQEEWQCYNWT